MVVRREVPMGGKRSCGVIGRPPSFFAHRHLSSDVGWDRRKNGKVLRGADRLHDCLIFNLIFV